MTSTSEVILEKGEDFLSNTLLSIDLYDPDNPDIRDGGPKVLNSKISNGLTVKLRNDNLIIYNLMSNDLLSHVVI
jgi:hypothetical protein